MNLKQLKKDMKKENFVPKVSVRLSKTKTVPYVKPEKPKFSEDELAELKTLSKKDKKKKVLELQAKYGVKNEG